MNRHDPKASANRQRFILHGFDEKEFLQLRHLFGHPGGEVVGLIFLLFKLFVAQYSIQFSAFTKAAVAALILGKVVPLLDCAQSGYRFKNHRRIVVVATKTLIYALVVIVL